MDWQPIETAPKDGTRILVCGGTCLDVLDNEYPFGGVSIVSYGHDAFIGELDECGYRWSNKPTHWMPLPPPPTDQHQKGQPS